MKKMKKIFALLIAMVMVFGLSVSVFAQTEGTPAEGKGSITINNAAKGETYSVVKIFGATLTEDGKGIAYTGTIPEALKDYFETDTVGNIIKKDGVEDSALITAVQAYAKGQTATASAVSDGSALTFQGLDYGYYAVISTQGATVTIDSTMPDATVYDKNGTIITKPEKKVKNTSYSIGDTINYTATFGTTNYLGDGEDAQQVIKYTITDTLPKFLSNVVIDSIVITKKDGTTTDATITGKSFVNGSFDIDWADAVPDTDPVEYKSKYDGGAKIIVTYHGTLTDVTNINTADTNTIKINPTLVNKTTPEPDQETWKDSAEIHTYGAALKKVDGESKKGLAGAEFTVKGLTVKEGDAAGEYIVESYDPDPDSTKESATLVTNDEGKLYIIGLAENVSLTVTETKAPDGYNKLNNPVTLTPQVMTTAIYTASGTIYYDADGNVVAEESSTTTSKTVEKNLTDLDAQALEVDNNKGTELPSTGGIGTTIFYIIGALLVIGAGVVLVTRRRMKAN